jgi:hypothetical protein
VSDFVQAYADKIPDTHGAPQRPVAARNSEVPRAAFGG